MARKKIAKQSISQNRKAAKARPHKAKVGKAKTRKVKPIPTGYHSITPYLIVNGAAAALAFYKKAFGAKEKLRLPAPGGRIGHAEIQIGTSRVMLADENPAMGAHAPNSVTPPPVGIMLYIKDVDTVFERAVAAGARVERPLQNQFYGDRMGGLMDPFGHRWYLGTHIEDVPLKELQRRVQEVMK